MYVVTFYSFKGGVGRSMAMMNTAAALVEEGRRVLVVDFDLEAPGLDTFNLPQPAGQKRGVVDYVTKFLETNSAPSIEEYVYKSSLEIESKGELWFMPAGERNDEYAARLAAINWRYLYDRREGFLLFENLKAQWKDYLDPDYVLVDSRTGHTDVGGICTRQLPDAVVCLFFPTEQNLLGLLPVVERIRDENQSREKKVRLHFVTSNVPDLDDENSILETRLRQFKQKLGYREVASTIHHYPSLALLNQDIFTRDRPNSRLSAEYRKLVAEIQKANPEDREGVLSFLRDARRVRRLDGSSAADIEDRLGQILASHSQDTEVLRGLAALRERQGQLEEAEALIARTLEIDPAQPALVIQMANLADRLQQRDVAAEYAAQASQMEGLDPFELTRVVRLLITNNPDALSDIGAWPSVADLGRADVIALTQSLSFDRNLLDEAEQLIRGSFQTGADSRADNILLLNLIGQRKFQEATSLAERLLENTKDQPTLFNLAIARWGEQAELPRDDFRAVVESVRNETTRDYANYFQCMSLSHWAIGDNEEARALLNRSRQAIMSNPTTSFSCWRYLNTSPRGFREDLARQEEMIDGGDVLPTVISGSLGDD